MPKSRKLMSSKAFPKHDILNYFMVDLLDALEHATKEIGRRGKPIALEAKATVITAPNVSELTWLVERIQTFLEDIQGETAPHLSIGRPRINYTLDDMGGQYITAKVIADIVD